MAYFTGGLDILPSKVRRVAEQQIGESEELQFCLLGDHKQSLIALGDRIIIIKPGFLAGAAFGEVVSSFRYDEIKGIDVNTGLLISFVEFRTKKMGGKAKGFWASKPQDDPMKAPNCLPIHKNYLSEYQPYLDKIRLFSKKKQSEGMSSSEDMVGKLEKLSSLHSSGVLSDAEFERAKQKLLS